MPQPKPCFVFTSRGWALNLSIVSLIASAIFYAAVSLQPPDDSTCTRLLFPSSEGLEAVRYRWENFRDYFVPPSVYRGPPAAEREKAWDDLAPFGVIRTSSPEEEPAYSILGVTLQMHCLKQIRQYAYRDANQTFFSPPARNHLDGCIEILREQLMCACDATPYLIANSANSHRGVLPVIGNWHYCRDYEAVAGWAAARFVDLKQALGTHHGGMWKLGGIADEMDMNMNMHGGGHGQGHGHGHGHGHS